MIYKLFSSWGHKVWGGSPFKRYTLKIAGLF